MLDNLQAIRRESARFSDVVADADPAAPVPSCPEWSVRGLVEHLGGVQRFWAGTVTEGDRDRPSDREHPFTGSEGELAGWMRGSTDALLAALGKTDDDAPCWTWWGAPRTCGAVARHQVHEAAVHRWDLEAAVGLAAPLDADVAEDGVAEFLEIILGSTATTLLGSVSLVSDDTGGEWIVGDQRGPHAEVHGSASDLVLLLYGRLTPSSVRVDGDPALLDELLGSADTD